MDIYKINFNNHINSGLLLFLTVVISICFPYGMSIIKHENIDSFIWIGIVMFVITALPAIIIHINYYLVNKGDTLEYSINNKVIAIIHKGKRTEFSFEDIERIQRFMSWNKAEKRSFILSWEGYNHSYIYLKDGKCFTVTSLLVPNLDLPLKDGIMEIKKNFYRLAKMY